MSFDLTTTDPELWRDHTDAEVRQLATYLERRRAYWTKVDGIMAERYERAHTGVVRACVARGIAIPAIGGDDGDLITFGGCNCDDGAPCDDARCTMERDLDARRQRAAYDTYTVLGTADPDDGDLERLDLALDDGDLERLDLALDHAAGRLDDLRPAERVIVKGDLL